jgi:hypothetical protein
MYGAQVMARFNRRYLSETSINIRNRIDDCFDCCHLRLGRRHERRHDGWRGSAHGAASAGRLIDYNPGPRRNEERQRAQQAYDHDMQRLDRQMRQKEQALNAETQKTAPDKTKIEKLRCCPGDDNRR